MEALQQRRHHTVELLRHVAVFLQLPRVEGVLVVIQLPCLVPILLIQHPTPRKHSTSKTRRKLNDLRSRNMGPKPVDVIQTAAHPLRLEGYLEPDVEMLRQRKEFGPFQ